MNLNRSEQTSTISSGQQVSQLYYKKVKINSYSLLLVQSSNLRPQFYADKSEIWGFCAHASSVNPLSSPNLIIRINEWNQTEYIQNLFAVILIIMISGSIKIRKPTPASITQGKMHNSKPSWARSNRLQTYSMMNNKEEWAALLTLSLTGISVGAGPVVRKPQMAKSCHQQQTADCCWVCAHSVAAVRCCQVGRCVWCSRLTINTAQHSGQTPQTLIKRTRASACLEYEAWGLYA